MKNLDEMRALGHDWDSYGAVPITAAAIETAKEIEYVPMSDGGIQIELHAGGAETEIEIGPDGKVRSMLWELDG